MKLWKTIREQGRRERTYLRAMSLRKKFVYVMEWFVAGAAGYALLAGMLSLMYISFVLLKIVPNWAYIVLFGLAPFYPLYSVIDRQQMRVELWESQEREKAAHRARLNGIADSLGVDDATN